MNRPELQTVSITPNPANARATMTLVIGVEDREIVFSTEYRYAKSSGTEMYTGEDGII